MFQSKKTYNINKLGNSENPGKRYPDKLLLSRRLQKCIEPPYCCARASPMLWYISIRAATTVLLGLHNNNYLNIRKKSNKQNDYLPLKREVRSLESNNQNVDSEKLENFHAKKAASLRDVEELQSHRRVVVEDFQDA
ncbi:hypothetical protein ACFX2J_031769 [Malus domestica]